MSHVTTRGTAQSVTITVRPEVAAFAETMEAKLRANDHKSHWRESLNPSIAFLRLMDEMHELARALLHQDAREIVEEAADVANVAMIVADLSGGLTVTSSGVDGHESERGEA